MKDHDAIREAAKNLSREAAAAIDLYVLEQGPLKIEYDTAGPRFVAKQDVRLRLKTADEIRNATVQGIYTHLYGNGAAAIWPGALNSIRIWAQSEGLEDPK